MAQNLQAAFDAIENALPSDAERKTAMLLGSQEDLKPLSRALLADGHITLTDEEGNEIQITREDLSFIRFRLATLRSYQVDMRQFTRRDTFRRLVSVRQTTEFF